MKGSLKSPLGAMRHSRMAIMVGALAATVGIGGTSAPSVVAAASAPKAVVETRQMRKRKGVFALKLDNPKASGGRYPNAKQYGHRPGDATHTVVSWKRERRRMLMKQYGITSGRQWVRLRKRLGLYVGPITREGGAV